MIYNAYIYILFCQCDFFFLHPWTCVFHSPLYSYSFLSKTASQIIRLMIISALKCNAVITFITSVDFLWPYNDEHWNGRNSSRGLPPKKVNCIWKGLKKKKRKKYSDVFRGKIYKWENEWNSKSLAIWFIISPLNALISPILQIADC